ncbi:uroporphyrinogen-III C-methyltransferase [Anoxybacter fermentans]|uniref:uroporphyrinogen-III C-methyltransferase n=1 Tax=Anoxybacter fermentans TaxID=1323375 RepID=A0A3S9SYP7_9FIRM|nr:uroporphyrinogen-III C-methyltransferase [Anoxybacter fermentans]AZR73292.1 uroporphyrinogen-III C-methyltransferase [Anoxybacter fermentans]
MKKKGKVYLVGAGPGDPGLITVKGLNCIREADMIVYDRLVNPLLLREVKDGAELKYVGKSVNHHTLSQNEINRLLVNEALKGKIVTRLKCGDPFIFGRGGEEAEELAKAGIDFEVVPGITSAIAVPAYGGIPLTHREINSTVTFITGHEDPLKEETAVDWEHLAKEKGTLVFLMGVGNLPKIVKQLLKYGHSPETPVALIQWGTRPEQRTVTGKLTNIVEKVREARITPPAIIVVGEVVRLRENLNWFETKPLFKKRILITRARHQAGELSCLLQNLGAKVIECPTIKITPPKDWKPLDERIKRLSEYQWVIFTSVNGVEYFMHRLFANGLDVRALGNVRIATIGSATAKKLKDYGLIADFIPDKFIAEELASGLAEITDLKGAKILIPRAASARVLLVEKLKEAGAKVDEVATYQTVLGDGLKELPMLFKKGKIQVVTFTSSSTVRNLAEFLYPQSFGQMLKNVIVACIGPITANTVKELGGHVDLIAMEHTITGLVESLVRYFA